MGIYIKGVKKPLNCNECFFWGKCPYIAKEINNSNIWLFEELKSDDCPIIEVSVPHGDLVDGHALTFSHPEPNLTLWKGDTIIPAEFEE